MPALHLLRRLRQWLVRILEWVLVGLMAALVLDVVWQVASRYLLKSPSAWTDELATLLMIWVALLGASVAFFKGGHLGVDFLVSKFSPAARRAAEILAFLLIALFGGAVLVYGGLKLVTLVLLTDQVTPALGVKLGHVYLSLPISGAFTLLFAIESALERICEPGEKGGA